MKSTDTTKTCETKVIRIEEIHVDDSLNCRERQPEWEIDSLVDSIEERGLLIPIVVIWDDTINQYRLVAGFRRLRAMQRLKMPMIRANVLGGLTEEDIQIVNLMENLERCQLTVLEEAQTIARLFPGESLEVIGKKLHKGMDWVRARRLLLEMDEKVQKAAGAGMLTGSQVIQLHGARGHERARMLREFCHMQPKKRTTPEVRSKNDLLDMMVKILDAGQTGISLRLIAWMSKMITTDELLADLEQATARVRLLEQESNNA